MIELARRLDRRDFQVHLVCFHREGSWLPRAERDAASIEQFPINSFRRPATVTQMRAFARWCRRTEIAVVHATDLYANIFALPAAAAAGVPVRVGNRREINPDKSAGLILLQRAAYACASRVAANSQAAADRLRRERVPARKITVIPNGLDIGAFVPPQPRDRVRRVITVANLRKEKAHEVLFDAAAAVLSKYPDAEFWIVGDGPRYEELTALARSRGIAARTRFFGHREDVPQLLADSDVFVLPSRSEAFPGSLVEAMAAGLPVVATAVGGNPELVQHGHNGLLVEPDDAQAVAASIRHLIDSPVRAAELGRAARASVERRFSFERMVSAFEDLYRSEFELASRLVRRPVNARRRSVAVEPQAAAGPGGVHPSTVARGGSPQL